jgi:hypothetical protein
MAIEKEIVLNKLEINVNTPHIEVVKRVSFIEGGEEISRTHTDFLYTFDNDEHLFASESVFIQGIWNDVSASWVETTGSIE